MAPWNRKQRNRLPAVSSPVGRNSLVAAGTRVRPVEAQLMRRLIQPWQTRALSYYDMIGEIKYAANYVGHAMSLLDLYVGVIQDDGEIEPTDNQIAEDALARIQDPGGGRGVRTGLQEQYGKLMFLTGEVYLLVSNDPFTGLEQWEMLSTDELRVMDGIIMRYRAPSLLVQDYQFPKDEDFYPINDDTAVAYRLWKRSPRWSALADSNMAAVLLLCEELVLLTAVVRARAKSRQAGNGILFISEDFSQTPLEPIGDEDPLNDVFLQNLIESMTASLENEGSASAVVPLIVRGPTDAIDKGVKHVQLVDPVQLYPETGLREECIRRISIGLDIPAEILTGLGELSHWNAWQVDESVWKAHLQPMAQQLCSDLTQAYLRPYLRDQGVEDWDTYTISYDASNIINRPDRSEAAIQAFDRGALSDDALRSSLGFEDSDAPSDAERNVWLGTKLRDSSLAVYGVPALPRGGELEPAPGEILAPSDGGAPGGGGENVTKAPGKTKPVGASSEKSAKDAPDEPVPGTVIGSAADLQIAGQLAVLRVRELAGSRLRSYAKRDSEALKSIEGVRTGLVAGKLGPDRVKALSRQSENQLVAGARDHIEDALKVCRITDPALVELFVSNVEKHAAQTLYDEQPRPLPSSLINRLVAARKESK